jgi:14-3-3 protein epsilon
MQLLRDNLTLWTSSDGGEPEAATGEAKAEEKAPAPTEEKPAEPEQTAA